MTNVNILHQEAISKNDMMTTMENGAGTVVPVRRSARLSGILTEDNNSVPDKPPQKQLEYINYTGAIKYYTDSIYIAEQSDAITEWVKEQTDAVIPMAFDMEWPFSFQTGPGKSSVIQVCVDESCCYVFQLTNLKKLPPALMELLYHPKIVLHGVNIKADFRKLARDFPEVNADNLISKCVDLGVWYNEIRESSGRWSLERLTNHIAELALDKNKKVRMSKWHIVPLDKNQLTYAAIDVYIGQVIYRKLQQLEETKRKNEEQFKSDNGENAFKAMKALGKTFE